jgi:hypothetical protein
MARGQTTISTLCLSVLVWIVWSWISFLWFSARELEALRIVRKVNGREQSTGILWANRKVDIELVLDCQDRFFRTAQRIRDVPPENLQLAQTQSDPGPSAIPWLASLWRPMRNLVLIERENVNANETRIQKPKNSVRIAYSAHALGAGALVMPGVRIEFHDPWKFFRKETFVEAKQSFLVLPSFIPLKDTSPMLKKLSVIPRQGLHRYQRPGIGFELLELREYVDGDPPKSIAWKASARREKLMARQYESEVPVRVQLILDGTASTRVGGFGLRLIDQITSVAATLAHSVVHAGDAVGAYLVGDTETQHIPSATGIKGFYQQMQGMAKFATNSCPSQTLASVALLETAYTICNERFPELLDPQINPISMSSFSWLITRATRQRTQLAAVMAELYDLSPITQVELNWNAPLLAKYLARFLSECGAPWMAPMVSSTDTSWLRSSARSSLLAKAMLSAVGRASDNEVFVLITELTGMQFHRSDFFETLKIAKAKHHRVAVVIPSPTFIRPKPLELESRIFSASDLRQEAEHLRLHEWMAPLKRNLAKLGIPVAISGEAKTMRLVLSEIEIARDGRVGVSGAKR